MNRTDPRIAITLTLLTAPHAADERPLPLGLDPDLQIAVIAGVLIALPPREFRLLQCLTAHAGHIVNRRALVKANVSSSRSGVSLIAHRLRQAIGERGGPAAMIRTHHREGYSLDVASLIGAALALSVGRRPPSARTIRAAA